MKKRPISKTFKNRTKNLFLKKRYSDEDFKQLIAKDLDNPIFEAHCQQTADNLNVDIVIVRELLMDNSLTVLSLIQKSVLNDKEIKINITGYFSLITTLFHFKIRNLKILKHHIKTI